MRSVPEIDRDHLLEVLVELLRTPSPSGRTDQVVQLVGDRVRALGFDPTVTRRGALRVDWGTGGEGPRRALLAHVDTLGCMVKELKGNGRLAVVPIGTHSARFAEGARVTIFPGSPEMPSLTGTILPLKASGHRYHHEVDTQGVGWHQVEVRVDAAVEGTSDLVALGIHVGDFVALDAVPQVSADGYVNSRHLDDKAGVAVLLVVLKAMLEAGCEPAVHTQLLFTISEEVGHGASNGLDDEVAELVAIDNGVVAPGQQSSELAATIVMQDLHGPFDYHLTRRLIGLCEEHGIAHRRDVFEHYRSDAAAALEAGMATRAALVGFGVDASHGYERTHLDGLVEVARLLTVYLMSDLTFAGWDRTPTGHLEDFPSTSVQPAPLQGPR